MDTYGDELVAVNEVFAGGGEMGRLMAAIDWPRTPLGPVAGWPRSLRTAVSICLNSRFPILVWWGPEYVKLYNDAYRPILGQKKHPRALGCPGREIWPEIWDIIGPMLDGVYQDGRATWSHDQLLLMDRNGYLEEAYFTFSYSPIRDESGGIGGIFTAVTETTERVLSERRLRTLQELSIEANTVEDAAAEALEILAKNQQDVPFALLYLLEERGAAARLAGATGLHRGGEASPERVELSGAPSGEHAWPLAEVATSGQPAMVDDLSARFGALPCGAWSDPPASALVLPIAQPGQPAPAGLLVLGISPRRAFDAGYRAFFDSLADHFATAFTNARAYEEERHRAESLVELDRAKTEFFSNISHEFRTPLTLQLGPLQDLVEGRLGPLDAGQQEAVGMAYRNSLRSLKLVNALLDFTRVEAGRMQAEYEPVDLAALTVDLASNFRSAIEAAGLRFEVDCPPQAGAEPVYVDRNLWEQIVLNLLSNALKFTLKGEIRVAVRQGDGRATLTVSDTGAGIAPGEVERIFERFYRPREVQSRTLEGAGIGLALVQELVKLHGGTVGVESTPGRGSAFTVTLPLGRSHLPADQIVPARWNAAGSLATRSYVEEAQHWLAGSAEPETDAHPPAERLDQGEDASDRPTPARPLILIADDNADMRAYLARILGERYRVESVADGEAALAAAQQDRPDLILADVMMPCLDGFGLLAALRGDPNLQRVAVIMLSARAGEEARAEGLEAGADDYLVKPFGARELLARVAKCLDNASAAERREREALADSNERLHLLHEMDLGILGTTSLTEIAQTAARHLRAGMDAYRVSILLFELDADFGRVLAADADPAFGAGPVDVPSLSRLPALEAVRRGEVSYVEDLAVEAGVHPLQDALLAAGVRSLTVIPLQAGGDGVWRTIGCLLIACLPAGRPDPELIAFARQVAVSLSLAIRTAAQVEQMAEREARLAETAAMLQASRQEFQTLSRRLVEALEEERETLARNLHDEAGQTLTVLGLGLARLGRQGRLDPEAAQRVAELKELATNLAIDLRRIATNLRPASLDQLGLIPALRQYAESYTQQTGIAVDVVTAGMHGIRRDPDVETVLYRIAQESLTNVAHHAAATAVQIEVHAAPGELELTVSDNGRGFDIDEALRRGRLGLLGMRERAAMLGGTVTVESAPGTGAVVRARVPVGGGQTPQM